MSTRTMDGITLMRPSRDVIFPDPAQGITKNSKIALGIIVASALVLASLVIPQLTRAQSSPPVTAPGLNKLLCFDGVTEGGGYGGTCTLNANGAKGPATLDLSGDVIGGANYAGVYTLNSKMYGTKLSDITQLSYNYSANITPLPGNLSYNIPIDTDGNGSTDAYAFIDAYYCPGVDGFVDIINDPNCGIYYAGNTFYANWAALVAAYPDAMVANDNYVFIVAERTTEEPSAVYTVNNVKFGKAGK